MTQESLIPSDGSRKTPKLLLKPCFLAALACAATACVVTAAVMLTWRSQTDREVSSVGMHPSTLLIPLSEFPEGWSARPIDTGRLAVALFRGHRDAAIREYVLRSSELPNINQASQAIARYRTSEAAHQNYLDLRETSFDGMQPWPDMSAWNHGIRAEEYELVFALSVQDGRTIGHCEFVARYGRYVSDFVFTI